MDLKHGAAEFIYTGLSQTSDNTSSSYIDVEQYVTIRKLVIIFSGYLTVFTRVENSNTLGLIFVYGCSPSVACFTM
jgi:hypothetical protein